MMSQPVVSSDDYDLKVRQQIDQYATEAIHDLPPIFHVWSHNFIRPGLSEVYGVETVNDFYLGAAREASDGFSRAVRILSVGCGDGAVEMELAETLRALGADFRLEAADLSPVLVERFQAAVRERSLEHYVFPRVEDLNDVSDAPLFDVVMANHSLHHVVDLERLFQFIWNALTPEGVFVTSDMIGRNGHMRWPEAEVMLQAVWPMLSDKQKFHHQLLKHHQDRFEDYDCSVEGFEGVRAQDILYLILNRFHAHKFFGFGGFIDVLVDRGFGHGFDAEKDADRELIMFLGQLNDMMLDAGCLKPTMMMAYFTKDDRGETKFRGRSARASVRLPFDDPVWPQYYDG